MDDIVQNEGSNHVRKREEEIVESFTNVQKLDGQVCYINGTQNKYGCDSNSKRADTYVGEEKAKDAVRNKTLICAQPVLRKETDTDRASYKSASEEEPGYVKKNLRKQMALRTKTTKTGHTSHAPPETNHLDEREERYP